MSNAVSRTRFIQDLVAAPIDVARMSPSLAKALEAQGVSAADLESIAGKDGKISGTGELGKLFDLVDKLETTGPRNAFAPTDEAGAFTAPGAVHDALKSEVAAARAVANASLGAPEYAKRMGASAKYPVIDVNDLSPELAAAFKDANIDPKAAAGIDGRIRRDTDWKRLQAQLDSADGAADGKASGLMRDESGAVVDSPIASLNRAIEDEIKSNAGKPKYAKPGSKPAPEQPKLTIAADALEIPEADRKPSVDLEVAYKSQFSLYPGDPAKGGKACFDAATMQTETYNTKAFKHGERPVLAGGGSAIQVAYAEDSAGRVAVDPNQAKLGRDYIDAQLDAGRPVMVGVSYADKSYNKDQMTDHFVTIDGRGYDADGRVFYTFKDPGANAAGQDGQLYVDAATGKMFKEGDHKGHYVQNADYQLTQVRTYKE